MTSTRAWLTTSGGRVTAAVHVPSKASGPALLLTHGAGGDLDSEGLVALADGLAEKVTLTIRVNLPYRESGRRSPPRAEQMAKPFAEIVDAARARFAPRRPWIAGGKSYGGRVASLAVASGLKAAGLVFYGYPLHPPGKPERLRVDHWPAITVPCLFLQGTRDPFCDLELLERHMHELAGEPTLHIVEGGDHSLRVTAKASADGVGRSPKATLAELAGTVAGWLKGI